MAHRSRSFAAIALISIQQPTDCHLPFITFIVDDYVGLKDIAPSMADLRHK